MVVGRLVVGCDVEMIVVGTVTMMSGKFCPVSRVSGSCSMPRFNSTWHVSAIE